MSSQPHYDPDPRQGNLRNIQSGIDDVTEIMRQNIKAAQENGEDIHRLQHSTQNMAEQAHGFRRGANAARKRFWWNDVKMRIWLGVGIVVLLAIIIIPSVVATRK